MDWLVDLPIYLASKPTNSTYMDLSRSACLLLAGLIADPALCLIASAMLPTQIGMKIGDDGNSFHSLPRAPSRQHGETNCLAQIEML